MKHAQSTLSITLGIHLFALALWYGPATGHPVLLNSLPFFGSVVGGFVTGYILRSRFLFVVLLLSVSQALVTGVAHLVAAHFGIQVDMRGIDSLILVIPLIPIFIIFTTLGCGAGKLAYWLISMSH